MGCFYSDGSIIPKIMNDSSENDHESDDDVNLIDEIIIIEDKDKDENEKNEIVIVMNEDATDTMIVVPVNDPEKNQVLDLEDYEDGLPAYNLDWNKVGSA